VIAAPRPRLVRPEPHEAVVGGAPRQLGWEGRREQVEVAWATGIDATVALVIARPAP
jgi:hypothetical protein